MLAGRIYARLCSESCPQAIGIYGGWGTGKTSVLNLLQRTNEGKIGANRREDIHFIVVDAWKYEAGGSLLVPVIVKLKELLAYEELPDAWQTITRRVLTATALTVVDALLKKFTDLDRKTVKETFDEAEIRDKQKDYSGILLEWKRWTDEIDSTELAFEQIVEAILKRRNFRRVIVCIDNLDRCSPDQAINLLESIRNFFLVPGCAWVLAVDSDVVASYITKKYEDTGVDGYSYLDKVIPEQYHLSLSPTMDRDGIADILNSVVDIVGDSQQRIDDRKIPQIPKILVPRRLIKAARKFYEYYQDPAEGVSPDTVLSLTLLYHTWPNFYQRLSSASEEHVSGILNHFFENNASLWKPGKIPLSDTFTKDEELNYFIRSAFMEFVTENKQLFIRELLVAMKELRQLGLP